MTLRVLIADCQLELVPENIAGHPVVRKQALQAGRKPGQMLLDQNIHRPAMKKIPNEDRRGRPDIAHISLLNLLETPLAKAGKLEVALHTCNDELITFRSDTRLPRGENRFHGVMSKVLRFGQSSEENPLIEMESNCTPAQAMERFARGTVIRMDLKGEAFDPAEMTGDVTILIGGFAHGGFRDGYTADAARTLGDEELNAWYVASHILHHYQANL